MANTTRKRMRGRTPGPYYPGKEPPTSILFTTEGSRLLKKAADRTGRSRSDVAEHLLRMHASDLAIAPGSPRPLYPGKGKNTTVTLTPLGNRLLQHAKARNGYSQGEILEHLLRLHGGDLVFDERAPAAAGA